MRSVLRNEASVRSIGSNPIAAALISLMLLAPFVVLEFLNNTVTRRNAPALVVLFGLLWLLPAAFVMLLMPMVRTARGESSAPASPLGLLLRITFMVLIAGIWAVLVVDQLPCFMGVTNCD